MKDYDSSAAWNAVRSAYEKHRDELIVSPAWLATETMRAIGAERSTNELEYLFAHLQARQIARQFCRQRFEDDETADRDDLFPTTLQHRYPRKPETSESEPSYVLRESMSADDVDWNVTRLRREASSKLAHADALEAWGRGRSLGQAA